MNIFYSPTGIVDSRHPAQGLTDMSHAGLKHIALDLAMYCSGHDLENYGKPMQPCRPVPRGNNPQCGDCRPKADKGTPGNDTAAKKTANPNPYSDASDRVSSICTPEAMLKNLRPFLEQCRSLGLSVQFLRVPRLPWDSKRRDLNPLLEQIAHSAVRLCGKIGCRYLAVSPLFASIEKGTEWQINRAYYLRLAKAARRYRITLLLENQCRSHNGHLLRGICSDGAEAAAWIDMLNAEVARQDNLLHAEIPAQDHSSSTEAPAQDHSSCAEALAQDHSQPRSDSPVFAFCLDTGICTLCGQDMQAFVSALGRRLQAVILRDCGRQQESSLLPFTSAFQGQPGTDWLSLIRGLRSMDFGGSLVLDFADTAAAFSPLLRPQLLPLAKSAAEYFKWQIELESLLKKYESIVLFGAGNMCRNYMKCYGSQYPPLFTCDNNPAVWGTTICGLEIKPPEALKELPDSYGIFICNIYYREIETQLRKMGIKNIEFFNDEYMPSFHFDRLEMY
ncbi:sugar phosphate isomerase/epimerase family protein [Schaedlerella sp.]|uniref:sugar phosphate isomerase/epimerase family protein n=1 Tax=Schaedlerella sp. TaxID=2676057 RepID=UPI003746C57A